jgi:predicted 3-demethylubiquinone-9 3-methyltransferase (glyoxalase superfamily)
MPKITPFLWFDTQAEEAMRFYASVFPNSKLNNVWKGPDGGVMGVNATLDGQEVRGLNGGPKFKFTEAFSFFVDCRDQAEVDRYWNALTADGGQESRCGWLKDKYGLSWQIVPVQFGQLMARDRSGRVMQALLKMNKIIIADLEAAAQG